MPEKLPGKYGVHSEEYLPFPGCQQACRFHRETVSKQVQQTQPVIHTRGEEVIKLNGAVARWPRPPTTSPSSPLVYVVMRRQAGTSSSWRQITQLQQKAADDDDFFSRLIFSDEATFHTSEKINKHNYRVWGTQKPYRIIEHERDLPKVNVFCALSQRKLYGPFFFIEATVTGHSYLDMLEKWLTVDLTTRLPSAEGAKLGPATIRVLVVDPEGLVTIYSPVSPSGSLSPSVVTIGNDVNSKVISKVMAGHRKKINTEVAPTTTKSPTDNDIMTFKIKRWRIKARDRDRMEGGYTRRTIVPKQKKKKKRDEVTGEWRKLHNAELHSLYSSLNIIRNIKAFKYDEMKSE
ncbi:hypothetical protein ANN_00569 [Periplaneta americana]|uniref:Uncharacterized protein n=1 Tax=Periplaneta americana TaxID=6978 RepID=A0ABQ8TR49_PERAM|nr:hypothetical protein ANN_00569 [Periplaneta americana]